MPYTDKFQPFEDIIREIMIVYKHDERPWLIGYSGGKDSTLLVCLVYEAMLRLKAAGAELKKKIYVITSDTMVENPIVKKYMHSSNESINIAASKDKICIEATIIYPESEQTFWSRVIGLGYPTPEPPGFRWCTERLKINPMNKFVNEKIEENGEIVILLGVRKGESLTRQKTITAREIEGKLLNMHNDIPNAYVYNPITEVPNDLVWDFLLKGDCKSPWGSDMKYLFSLYQGESLGEEQSVLGEIDREKIPVTGNSRFGCWCCTMVKEDKSLQNFIDKGARELIPLRNFRNMLLRMREDSRYRDTKRRNGTVYKKADEYFQKMKGLSSEIASSEIAKAMVLLQKDYSDNDDVSILYSFSSNPIGKVSPFLEMLKKAKDDIDTVSEQMHNEKELLIRNGSWNDNNDNVDRRFEKYQKDFDTIFDELKEV